MEKIRGIKFDTIPDCTSIPRGVEARTQLPIFLVVHLFSGRRRATDIHAKLEEFALGKGYRVQVLSLDTAVSIFYGNLQASQHTWKCLTTLYKAGRVSATILGSPCETFSAARNHQPDDATREVAQTTSERIAFLWTGWTHHQRIEASRTRSGIFPTGDSRCRLDPPAWRCLHQ